MLKGYMGKILRVNLTDGTITEEFPDDEILRNFLGGAGLATYYLINETEKGIDPLGPDNPLIFLARYMATPLALFFFRPLVMTCIDLQLNS